MRPTVAEFNKRHWTSRRAVTAYRRVPPVLQKAEQFILDMLADEFRNRRILDIGVGCGRTTAHLLRISNDYVGIDYSPAMIEICQGRYPDLDFQVCDARDLSRFAGETFDLVMFSYNGIDDVEHIDRLKILTEIHRICTETGIFVFSSHNFHAFDKSSVISLSLGSYREPLQMLRRVTGYIVRNINYRRLKNYECREDDYAIVNDGALRDGLSYCITPEKQIQQLQRCGFADVLTVDATGQCGNTFADGESVWIYYVARKTMMALAGEHVR